MAGHSKWANIKHRKAAADAKKGKVFTRISKEISIAAKNGGGDPDNNPRLRLAMTSARKANMSNDKITHAIKKGTGELDGQSYDELTYEGYAPHGVALIVETVTDNKNRTIADVRHCFNKYGGSLGETNSVAWNFSRKGTITIAGEGLNEDSVLEHVLESGAEDFTATDDAYVVYCSTEDFNDVQEYFSNSGLDVREAKTDLVPGTTVNIDTVEAAKKVIKFLDMMEELDDVQNVYSNFEIDDAIAEQLGE